MKSTTQKVILLLLCTFFCICCLSIINSFGHQANTVIRIGNFVLPIASLQGVISAVNMLFCILMVFIHYGIGSKIACCIIIYSAITSLLQIFRTHAMYSLPGFVSSLVSLVSIAIIYHFYKRSTLNSYTDLITGLKNRRKFIIEIDDRLQSKKDFCLACLEIKGFKQINDMYGIQSGDYILQKTAERIIRVLGKKDCVYKITGAIFVICFESEIVAQETLLELAKPEKVTIPLKNVLKESLPVVTVPLVAGVSRYPNDATTATLLLHHAGTALNAAKKSETKSVLFYTEDLGAEELKQKEAEELICTALEKEWFYLVYQPQFTLAGRRLRGFETLIRCKKDDGTVIPPSAFIPAAEKSNLIFKIDDYVLHHAMREFKPLLAEKGNAYIVSVNVSAKNISTPNFAERVKALLSETQFPPQCLEIEITEYSLSDSIETTIENIHKLRKEGVQVALDDFGTGYTSIAQLMKLPINLLKIDKSLIDNIESNQNIRDLVDSVIYMGHIMNCEVISEGVENEKQIGVLKEHKCDFVQGFVWGKPLSFGDAANLCS